MASPEIQLYINRAHQDLRASKNNLEQGFYDVSVTRAYYAMFYAAEEMLHDAQRFVERAEQYLHQAGMV